MVAELSISRLLVNEIKDLQVVGVLAYDPSQDAYMLLQRRDEGTPRRRQRCGEELSVRELQVLQLVARGYSNEELARKLHISLNTTKRHMQSIFLRLGAASRSEAVARAIHEGYLRFA